MDDLIEALQIFRKYENPQFPTHCEHDELNVCIDADNVSEEDILKLEELGFHKDESGEYFTSYRFGSC